MILLLTFFFIYQVTIFSKTTCPFCDRVKALFGGLSIPYHAVELDTMDEGPVIQQMLAGKQVIFFLFYFRVLYFKLNLPLPPPCAGSGLKRK